MVLQYTLPIMFDQNYYRFFLRPNNGQENVTTNDYQLVTNNPCQQLKTING